MPDPSMIHEGRIVPPPKGGRPPAMEAFAERRSLYDELFSRLDRAFDEGNGEALNSVVRGIVDIAQKSPLADIGDLSQVRAALDDPDQVWDL